MDAPDRTRWCGVPEPGSCPARRRSRGTRLTAPQPQRPHRAPPLPLAAPVDRMLVQPHLDLGHQLAQPRALRGRWAARAPGRRRDRHWARGSTPRLEPGLATTGHRRRPRAATAGRRRARRSKPAASSARSSGARDRMPSRGRCSVSSPATRCNGVASQHASAPAADEVPGDTGVAVAAALLRAQRRRPAEGHRAPGARADARARTASRPARGAVAPNRSARPDGPGVGARGLGTRHQVGNDEQEFAHIAYVIEA